MIDDRLDKMLKMREEYMIALHKFIPEGHPSEWPIDIIQKKNQQLIRDLAVRGIEELFEAIFLLKNYKPHKKTESSEFDREKFLEEIIDSLNYILSIPVLMGFTVDDVFRKYCEKDEVIHDRLKRGY